MVSGQVTDLQPWECLMKRIVWKQLGEIRYYEDKDIEKWCQELVITKTLGMGTFWDMQQNQEIQREADRQDTV